MKVAVEGCAHGELEKIYETIEFLEKKENIKVDLLLCCGDFQSVRNESDLLCMAVPPKYRQMCSFYKYYSGEKKAPILTLFIGGNHEASNYLAELPYGGWVCPNIYYLGYAGVVNFGGIRIAGISGIYKHHDYKKGHFEKPPFGQDTVRSIYHVRNLEVFRLKQIKQPLDIVLSHDWPRKVYSYGNTDELLRKKRFLKQEVESKQLGSPAAEELLHALKPSYWFSAHLHVKFPALIQHTTDSEDNDEEDGTGGDNGKINKTKITKFLALDKCLPYRDFLQVVDIPSITDGPNELMYDEEWIAILKSTNHLLRTTSQAINMPFPGLQERWNFTATDEELKTVRADCKDNFVIPENFEKTAPVYDPKQTPDAKRNKMPQGCVNPQTTRFCELFKITDPNAVNCRIGQEDTEIPQKADNPDEIDLGDDDSDDDDDDDSSSSSGIESSDVTDDIMTPDPSSDEVKKSDEYTTTELSSSSSPSYLTDETSTGTLTESSITEEPLPDVRRTAEDELCNKGPKRFKRRNQAIYEKREDDSDD